MPKTALLITAAGISSRMGSFKPMLSIGGQHLIDRTIGSFRTVNISETVIVTGYRADELHAHFASKDYRLVYNAQYDKTEMIDSIRLGLHHLHNRCERFFIMPADIPLVQPFSIEVLAETVAITPVVQPSYRGKHGHPLLISAACIPAILAFDGEGGLRGALQPFKKTTVELPDQGVVMDADTPEAFARIQALHQKIRIPSREMALFMLARHASERVTRHSLKVASVALNIAHRAKGLGLKLDLPLIEAAALLHDITRADGRGHERTACDALYRWGYPEVGHVVAAHTDLPSDALAPIDERAIVYLADKLVKDDVCVGLQSRFASVLERFTNDPDATAAAHRRLNDARAILEKLEITEDECLGM